jgi:DNA-binding Xre family transcriptional regulator
MSIAVRSKLFSAALDNLMQERGANQVELSQRTGIAISRINNYLKGKFRTVKPAHVEAMVEALGGGKAAGALIEAYLFDLLPENCRGLVEVKYPGMPTGGRWTPPSKGLSRDFAGQLRDLYRLCVISVKVRERTEAWIKIMREISG